MNKRVIRTVQSIVSAMLSPQLRKVYGIAHAIYTVGRAMDLYVAATVV